MQLILNEAELIQAFNERDEFVICNRRRKRILRMT